MPEQKVITAILPKGKAFDLIKVLVEERGMAAVDIHYARGVGRITPLMHRGIGESSEKEILSVAVDRGDADDLFEYIYNKAEINRPHGGLMYMHALTRSTGFKLPDLPEES